MLNIVFIAVLGVLCCTVLGQSTTPTWPTQPSAIPLYWQNPYRNNTTHKPPFNPNTLYSNASDANDNYTPSYSPARGPALPLAVRSPYTSAWTSTASNGSLNSNPVIFWDGSALGWEGIATVDGTSYEWMGIGSRDLPKLPNLISALPQAVAYDSQYSNFTFQAGPVEVFASFFSPVIPQDLCRTSIPLSYLTVTAKSLDGASHNVSLYNDVNGAWVTQPSAPLSWDIYKHGLTTSDVATNSSANSLYTWIVQLQTQYVLGENNGQAAARGGQGVFPQWGNFTFSSAQGSAQSISYQSGPAIDQRFKFVMGSELGNFVDKDFRAYDQAEPVFAYQHQLGAVGPQESAPVTYTIGLAVQPAARLLTAQGIESLQPWWYKCYGDLFSMITTHWNDLPTVTGLAASFEKKLQADISKYYGINDLDVDGIAGSGRIPHSANGTAYNNSPYANVTNSLRSRQENQDTSQIVFDSNNAYGWLEPVNDCNVTGVAEPEVSEARSYYSIVALAARQIMGGYILTVPSSTSTNQNDPLMFQKEISSNGNINTIDVIFPAMPFFLWANPDMIRYVLEPNFMNQEEGFYPNSYSMHDMGARFPNATGHVEGNDEYMPVEESGNMILMVYAIYKFTNNKSYLDAHYKILQQWAKYLIDYSLIPAVQLSTDDFAGELANQTNLAIKGIIGLAAMSEISSSVGDSASATRFSDIAKSYYDQWTGFAIDPSGKHTVLAYQWRSSWGLLYNIFPAKLLGLKIIPQSLYDLQSAFYPTVSQLWGVPLDNRHYWTKSDWELWTAAYCQPSTRALFVNSLAYWLNTTSSNLPFTDLYQTVHFGENPSVEFLARPVQGGLYSFLALLAGGTN